MRFGIREIFLCALLVAVPAGAWVFVFHPANLRHQEMRRQVSEKQTKLRKLNRIMSTVGSLQTEIAELEKAVSYLKAKLPCEKGIDEVLRGTWQLAEDNGLVTKSIRTIPRGVGSLYATGSQSEQPVQVHLEGDFEGFYAFLQALENQPRIMRISRMSLMRPDNATQGYIKVNFDMTVFFDSTKDKTWPTQNPM